MSEEKRAETGVMQFTDDWPGVFIRGDNAFGYAMALQGIQAAIDAGITPLSFHLSTLKYLTRLLLSCDARDNPESQKAQLLPEAASGVRDRGEK